MKVSHKFNYLANCSNNYAANILSILLVGKPLQEEYSLSMRRNLWSTTFWRNCQKGFISLSPAAYLERATKIIRSNIFLRSPAFVLEEDSSGLGGLLHLKFKKPSSASLGQQLEKVGRRKCDKQPDMKSITVFLRVLHLSKSKSTRCIRFRRNTENNFFTEW